MSEYRFVVDKTTLEGKQGILTPDSDGYYDDIIVGVFNAENTNGQRYIIDQKVKALLDSQLGVSRMSKWLLQGKLIGEKEHPRLEEFLCKDKTYEWSASMWLRRNAELLTSNISHRFAGWRTTAMPDKIDGRTVYGVYARLKPECRELDSSFGDPNANTAFSIRSMINRIFQGNELVKRCSEIFTFDGVSSNGLPRCEKFSMPGLESAGNTVTELDLTPRIIKDINEVYEDEGLDLALESSGGIITQMIKDKGVYREVPSLTHHVCLGRQLSGRKIYLG